MSGIKFIQPNCTVHFELPPCQSQPVGWIVHSDVEPMEVCKMDVFLYDASYLQHR